MEEGELSGMGGGTAGRGAGGQFMLGFVLSKVTRSLQGVRNGAQKWSRLVNLDPTAPQSGPYAAEWDNHTHESGRADSSGSANNGPESLDYEVVESLAYREDQVRGEGLFVEIIFVIGRLWIR